MKEEQKISLDGFLIFLAIVFAVFLVLSMLYEFYPRNTIVDGLLTIDLFLTISVIACSLVVLPYLPPDDDWKK